MKTKRLKIVTDGTELGTKILTEDGCEIAGVIGFGYEFDCTKNISKVMTIRVRDFDIEYVHKDV